MGLFGESEKQIKVMKMKKYIFTLLLIVSLSISGQTVNDIKIEDIPVRYVKLVIETKGMSAYNIKVWLDYGQMEKLRDEKGLIIADDGERMKFNSPISAMNFLEKKGYKLISNQLAYTPFYTILFENENYKKTK